MNRRQLFASGLLPTTTIVGLLLLSATAVRGAVAGKPLSDGTTNVTGTVEVSVADYFKEKYAEMYYHIKDDVSGKSYELIFSKKPPLALKTGARVRVHGRKFGGYILPEAAADETATNTTEQGGITLLNVAPKLASMTTDHKTIVMLVNFTNASISSTVSGISNIFFATSGQSVNLAYQEETYGAVSWSGKVIGPFTINADATGCDPTGWRSLADAQATAAGENLSLYQNKVYVVPGNGCGWAGLGSVGGNPAWALMYYTDGGSICHELGHNLGMAHASTDTNNDGVIDNEYGDESDFMGNPYDWRHNNGPHKVQMGWLPSGKIVNMAMGVYQLAPLESDPDTTTLPQVLKIAVPSTSESYYFSYRLAFGYDINLAATYKNRLNIHRWSSGAVETRFITSLTNGGAFTDSSVGFTIKQISNDSNAVTVSVLDCGSTPLPSPWTSDDIGTVGFAGCSGYTNGVFSVAGSGADIYGTADGFQFAHQAVTGDRQIEAHVVYQENTSSGAKSGVMFRDGIGSNAMFADMLVTPGNGVAFQWRNATGGSANGVNLAGPAAPVWLKLVRLGSNFSGYYSTNGSVWLQVGSAQAIPMSTTAEAGLAVTAHTNTTYAMTTFDNVSLAGQQYWDANGAVAGAGTTPSGTWSTNAAYWSSDAAGAQATTNWADGGNAIFSAGSDATGSYTVTVSGAPKVNNITIENGTPTITGGSLNFSSAAGIDTGSNTLTVNSIIAGGGFDKFGTGTLNLNAGSANQSNTYTGSLTIAGGTLSVGGGTAFADGGAIRSDVQINAGGTLRLGQSNVIANTAVITANSGAVFDMNNLAEGVGYLAGGGAVSNNTVGLTLDLGTSSQIFSGVISGAGGVTVRGNNGAGTQDFSGPNTYAGGTIVNAGTLNFFGDQSAATGGLQVGPTSTSVATVNIASGATVVVAAGKQIRVGNNTGSGNATQTLNVNGTVTNNGTLYVGRPGVVNLNLGAFWVQNNAMSINSQGGFNSSMTMDPGSSFIYSGPTAIGINPTVGNSGSASLTMNGGMFRTGNGFTNKSASSSGTASLNFFGGAILQLSADIPELFTTAGSTNNFKTGNVGLVIDTAGFSTTLNLPVTDISGQSGSIAKHGLGTLTLSGANTFSGGITVNSGGGSLLITTVNALGSGSISLVKEGTNSGTLQLALTGVNTVTNSFNGFHSTLFAGSSTVPDIENVSGTNKIIAGLIVSGTGGNGVSIQSDAGLLELAGSISATIASRGVELNGAGSGLVSGGIADGAGGLTLKVTKDGAGTWTFSNANPYTGSTTINAGTLLVNGSTGSGAVTVASGATLGGTGTVTGSVTLNGTIAPGGNGVGTLSTGGENWNVGGAFVFGINNATNSSGQDFLNINGALNVQSTAGSPFTIKLLSLTSSNTPGVLAGFANGSSNAWTLATASGGVANFDPAKFAVDTTGFSNAFTGTFRASTNGNSLVLNYVPAALVQPMVSSFSWNGTHAFSLAFSGPPGQGYKILASTNVALPLTGWQVLTSSIFGTGTVNFTDMTATNAQRFYRIASP
jgi:autotransporter-associated beta strand protein